ncbi:hypothetical protein G6514_010164 [Epicoccum nigrum]|nr:hypothetical protein G6514_010164 [Epicoccum nigrum]
MAPFTIPLRRIWSRGQAPEVAAPGSIAHLGGASDGEPHIQQSHPPISRQQPSDFPASLQMAGTAKLARAPSVDGNLQEHEQLDTHDLSQTVHKTQITDERQYDDMMQFFLSHTGDVQTSGPLSEHLHASDPIQMPSSPPVAIGEAEVKQEPVLDDQELFAYFTNEKIYEENSKESAETVQASSNGSGLVGQVPMSASIKSEPQSEDQTESHDMASKVCTTLSGSSSIAADMDPTTQSAHEPWVQDSTQQSIDCQASSTLESHQNLTDPAEESQRYGSVETAPSHGDMALMSVNDNQSAQLRQQIPYLINTDPVIAEQAYGYSSMVHGTTPTSSNFDHVKDQQSNGLSTFTSPSNLQSGNPSQRFPTLQPRVNTSYNGHLPHQSNSSHPSQQSLSLHPSNAHLFAQRMTSGYGASLQMSTPTWPVGDAFTSAEPVDPHNTQVDEGDVEMSDQSQALTIDKSSGDFAVSADPVIGEDPEDQIDDDAEPISWKLPSFEITYHSPEKPNENHGATVSIPNLVREHVALTDDHHQQEMQLFLEVFLPAQRALQTPDPEPAHAVINFHTISVMVLEAFVQWEIGDELGRGYGFHGGNTAMRPLPEGKEDVEPERIRSATDADVDEIFFTVVDRWRAGMLSNKGTFKLIRGCQEFCDTALDIIHFVKEHGLLTPEPKKRKARSSKDGAEDSKGKRKEDAGKVNNVPSRKKPKTEGKKPVAKPKKKEKATISVVRKK